MVQVLVQDVVKSSEIEGEHLDILQVRSSIARKLGMPYAGLPEPDRRTDGVVSMMLDATQRYAEPLTPDRLFDWHAALFPTGYSGLHKIAVARWRDDADGPMQVVSGPVGKQRVHYQAPDADRVPEEMARFLEWFEGQSDDPVIKAAIAHIWFVSIHPFDDGNGRIGRAIMDMALARADGSSRRFYSMSAQISADRNSYYDVLERTQKRSMDVTEWIAWFLVQLERALAQAEGVIRLVRNKQAFWEAFRDTDFNGRQTKLLNLLLDDQFFGKLTSDKYAKMMKCSRPTAVRDLNELVEGGVLGLGPAGGRSVSYVFRALGGGSPTDGTQE